VLVGREAELARVRALLEAARDGRSGALLLAGDAGIGKTALLDAALAEAAESELLVLRARGLQSESDIPFAGLSELLGPLLARLGTLPPAQAGALRAALALGGAGDDALRDRFAVSAAVLSLLAGAAEERPALVAADDVQWLDASSLEALLFAFRRLRAEGIAVLATLRTGHAIPAPWMERVEVGPLADADARALLGGEIAPPVAERLLAGAGGNPLALLEIPGLLTEAQRAGREPLESPLQPGTGIKRAFRRRVDGLPEDAHRALLVAAASDSGRLPEILAGLAALGLDEAALEPAETAELLRIAGGRVEFRQPLLRSTAYYAAASSERRAVHRALATGAPGGSAERAWHLAAAAVGPDEEVASALEAAAADARRRGAIGSAARDLARAAQLTPEPEMRARRLLAAAADTALGGEAPQARGYLAEAETLSAEPGLRSELRRLRANIDLRGGRPAEARDALTAEAAAAEAEDPLRAAGLYVEAAVTHMITADMHEPAALAERGRALAEGREPGLALLADLLIGESAVLQGETARGDALLRRGDPLVLEGDVLRLPQELVGMVGHCALWREQFERAERILRRIIAVYRDASAIVSVVYPLTAMAEIDFRLGRWAKAEAGVEEVLTLAEQTGHRTLETFSRVVRARVGAGRGLEEQVRADLEPVLAGLGAEGGTMRLFAIGALGHLELSLGRAEQAADARAARADERGTRAPQRRARDVGARPGRGADPRGQGVRGGGRRGAAGAPGGFVRRSLASGRRPALRRAARGRRRLPRAARGGARSACRAPHAVRAGAHAARARRAAAARR
jgi:hypothetical protein